MSSFSYKPVLTNEYFSGKPLTIDHRPQILAGETMVEDAYRVWQVQETPVRYSEEPVFYPDAPWETFFQMPIVIHDPDDGLYKMWYSTRKRNPDYEPKWETNLEAGNAEKFICYAESKDGIHWERPELDVVPFGQWKKNNIVFADSDVGATLGMVVLNPDKSDASKKFIMVWNEGYGVRITYSPDGIHWEKSVPILSISMDCSLVFGYDESRGVWQLFTRPAVPAKHDRMPAEPDVMPNRNYRRRVSVMESSDLVNWSTPRVVFHPDENQVATEADNITFFTSGNYPIGFIHMFSVRNLYECRYQFMRPYLAFGPDVFHLETLPDAKPVIDFGKRGAFDEYSVNIHGQPMKLFDDNRTYFYYCGSGRQEEKYAIGLLSYEDDRYCARMGDDFGGWLLTREFYFDGSSISINADIPDIDSEIVVELLDGDHGTVRGGRKIFGFTKEDCDKVTGGFNTKITWNGSDDLTALKGRAIHVRFGIKGAAKLYSFTVNE